MSPGPGPVSIMEEMDIQVDFCSNVSLAQGSHEEETASTPTLTTYMKAKKAEEYFSTGESKTNPSEGTTTPRQQNVTSSQAARSSHMKTPKMSNMRRLLGNLTDDLASPEHAKKQRAPGSQYTPQNTVQQRTPGETKTPMPNPPVRVPVNDSSSSSSGKADSNSVSGTTSQSNESFRIVKAAYRTTATLRNTDPPAKKPPRKTPGTQQAAVANRLLGRPKHNQPEVRHAINQLRDSDRQKSFEFPAFSPQQAPVNGGVIWNLDTPAELELQQRQNSKMPQPSVAHSSPVRHPVISNRPPASWEIYMSKSLPAEHPHVTAISSGYGAPPRLQQIFLQPDTASQYQNIAMALPTGSPIGDGSCARGTNRMHACPQSVSSMPAGFYSAQQVHVPAVQNDSVFYNSQGMQRVQPAYMSAGTVASQPHFSPPLLYTIPEVDAPAPTMHTSEPAWQSPSHAGDAGVPVIRNGRPYMRNGVPVRLPLQDTTNVLEGQDIQKIATMCYVQASQGHVPSHVDKHTVKKLVQQQIEASQPIRAPWYREGPRTSSGHRTWHSRGPASQHNPAYSHHKQGNKAGPSSSSQTGTRRENSIAQGTGCFIPTAHQLPRNSHMLSTRNTESSCAGPSAYNAPANSRQAPADVQVAGGRCMAVGTGCFIPSV